MTRKVDRFDFILYTAVAAAIILVTGVFGFVFWLPSLGVPTSSPRPAAPAAESEPPAAGVPLAAGVLPALFERYKMTPLAEAALAQPKIRDSLAALSREPCDNSLIYRATVALQQSGFKHEATRLLIGFGEVCPKSGNELLYAGEALYDMGDNAAALEVATKLVRIRPDYHLHYFLQARAFQGLGRYEEALEAYAAAFRLYSDPKIVSSEVFMRMAASYEALGRYCEAISLIQTYIAMAPDKRNTAELRRLIAEYARRGACDQNYAAGSVKKRRPTGGVIAVKAEIDGVTGNFIVDTGASFVAVTKDFATRAKLSSLTKGGRKAQTANGLIETSLTMARTIRLGEAHAASVPAMIVDGSMGPGVDGLLGMSFLARFDVVLTDRELKISAKQEK
ncbi:hypothetical+protein [Methylocapsa aurea]|uniref:retropepsin-like aspartic protease family protein n=1 Tax=Methylocapsa aurea TaxID=663610 RepID=UPI003D18C83C